MRPFLESSSVHHDNEIEFGAAVRKAHFSLEHPNADLALLLPSLVSTLCCQEKFFLLICWILDIPRFFSGCLTKQRWQGTVLETNLFSKFKLAIFLDLYATR